MSVVVVVVEANAVVVVEANALLLLLEHLLLLLPPYPFYGSAFPCTTSLSKHIQIGMNFLQTQTLHFIVHYNYHFVLFVLLLLNLHE